VTAKLYDTIIEITEGYLGPAAQRFIDRQIRFHLGKKPEVITRADIEKLTEWVQVSLALLTDDKVVVEEFSRRMAEI